MGKLLFLIVCLTAVFQTAIAQNALLPDVIRTSKNEYSGMCLYNGRVFLLPQSKKPGTLFSGHIHSIDTAKLELDKDLRVHVPLTAVRTYSISNLAEIAKSIPQFEGFEAICIANNTVFLTVETETDTDYVVKGHLRDTSIILSTNTLAIPKPRKEGVRLINAGLEGMTLHKDKLLIAFEYNYFGTATQLFIADSSFNTPAVLAPFTQLPFRLTDICDNGQGSFYAINHYWNFNGNASHKEAYYKDINASKDPDLKHWAWNECFTRIIDVRATPSGFTWETKEVIPNKECSNWEGIVPFRDGVLLISDDNKIPFLETKFRYFPLR